MDTIIIKKPGSIEIVKRKRPIFRKDEILVKLKYIGFCGSDLSTFLGKNPYVQYPRVPGHEISGVIEELGEDVPDRFTPGEKVTVIPYTNCGQCPSCLRGRSYACQFNQTMGIQRDGAMQEFISVPCLQVITAPVLSELELAMVEPLTVGFHAVDRGKVIDSDTVMVLGCGMIGAGAIVRSMLRGATVVAVDIDYHKLNLARELGAHYTINSITDNLHEELVRFTGGDGPDVVIEAAGNPITYLSAVDEVAFTGRVVCIGYSTTVVAFETRLFVQKELDIMGSRNATPEDFRAVISYLERGIFPLEKMITSKVKPENALKALQSWADEPGKVMKILLDLT